MLRSTRRPAWISRAVLSLALVVFIASPAPTAYGEGTDVLRARLSDIVRNAELGDAIGVHVVDATTGREIYGHQQDVPRNPASNMKLVTAAAALHHLGPSFQMRTGLYGHIRDGRVTDLVLRGFGDPYLTQADLVALGQDLRERGVRRVDRIHVDGSYFDDELLPPAFDQQPNETAVFRAAIAAVSVDRSTYAVRVVPGGPEQQAQAFIRGAGYFDVTNRMTTGPEGGSIRVGLSQRSIDDGARMSIRLTGNVPLGSAGQRYRKRVENPLAYAGHLLADSLTDLGIRGRHRVVLGGMAPGGALLASHYSPTLETVLRAVGKKSDNYVAEMVLKVMGAEQRTPGTSARGLEASRAFLRHAGVDPDGPTLVNGSGLFNGNLIAPSHLTGVLRHMYGRADLRDAYLAHLAVGGSEGTLRRRLRNLPAPRIVRAKTGTLRDTISLSGYVLGPEPGQAIAFSVLCNRVNGKIGQARQMADAVATQIARHLYGG